MIWLGISDCYESDGIGLPLSEGPPNGRLGVLLCTVF